MNSEDPKPLALADLPEHRRKTERVSRFFRDRLVRHLETIQPALAPERMLGRYVGGKVEVPAADRCVSKLEENYRRIAGVPYGLTSNFDASWLNLVGTRLELHSWDYLHEVKAPPMTKAITMTSPTRWVLNYRSEITPFQLTQALAGSAPRRPEMMRQFVVNALVLAEVVAQLPGLSVLLADLNFELKTEVTPNLPRLPLTIVSACLPSIRPPDELILDATALSGVPAFIELIDFEAVNRWQDPVKQQITQLISGGNPSPA